MASKRSIRAGDLMIGGGAPVVIQSMTNTDTRDVEATSAQIRRLYEAGLPACPGIRLRYPLRPGSTRVGGQESHPFGSGHPF